jgi:hypothetical protein
MPEKLPISPHIVRMVRKMETSAAFDESQEKPPERRVMSMRRFVAIRL